MTLWFVLFVLLLLALPVRAAPDEIPVVGRPADLPFSEASAGFFVRQGDQGDEYHCPFDVKGIPSAARVEVGRSLTFAVTIVALGKVHRPPVAFPLNDLPAFSQAFHVGDPIDASDEDAPGKWRWVYRLTPKRTDADEIPRVPFVFYNPDLAPSERAFQVLWTEPVPLTVIPIKQPEPKPIFSDNILALAPMPAVLANDAPWPGPGRALLACVLVGPPLLAVAWVVVWRRTYPDAARRATLRRSRAATRALTALKAAARLTGRPRAEATTKAVVAYLRERFDLPVTEPTPDEAADWLARQGVAGDDVGHLLYQCAAARFGPDQTADVVAAARAFIASMEEPPRTPSS